MRILIVVDQTERWPFALPGIEVVSGRDYLTSPEFSTLRGALVFNLCRSYGYQRTGYYVSLLAEARGHRPQPSVSTLQDIRHRSVVRIASDEVFDRMQRSLARIRSNEFVLSIYFGRPLSKVHAPLAQALFDQFPAPLLRARFRKDEDGEWQLVSVGPIAAEDVPESHRSVVVEAAGRYFANRRWSPRRRRAPRFHLAILVDPEEKYPPSDELALERFERAARHLEIATERIEPDDQGRLAEFDGLFIRATTSVNHYTYRFARRAAAEGLVVIDDPLSIIRCTNKVYLSELLDRHGVSQPRTLLVHQENRDKVGETLGLPCVLKQPDSAFSRGVVKVETPEELSTQLERLLSDSALVVAQEFVPTEYDWRIGVLDQRPLYACRYFMAKGHWQIMQHDGDKGTKYGKWETMPVELAPRPIVRAALKAANAVGTGLYGVDLKQNGKQILLMEVNDNPTIESGVEDQVLREDLYRRIMGVFLERMERRRAAGGSLA